MFLTNLQKEDEIIISFCATIIIIALIFLFVFIFKQINEYNDLDKKIRKTKKAERIYRNWKQK